MRVTRLENSPPVGYPVQFRVSGEHIDRVRALAKQVEAKVRENPNVTNVNLDWDEPRQGRAPGRGPGPRARAGRELSAALAKFLSGSLSACTSAPTARATS